MYVLGWHVSSVVPARLGKTAPVRLSAPVPWPLLLATVNRALHAASVRARTGGRLTDSQY